MVGLFIHRYKDDEIICRAHNLDTPATTLPIWCTNYLLKIATQYVINYWTIRSDFLQAVLGVQMVIIQ